MGGLQGGNWEFCVRNDKTGGKKKISKGAVEQGLYEGGVKTSGEKERGRGEGSGNLSRKRTTFERNPVGLHVLGLHKEMDTAYEGWSRRRIEKEVETRHCSKVNLWTNHRKNPHPGLIKGKGGVACGREGTHTRRAIFRKAVAFLKKEGQAEKRFLLGKLHE